ncbi:hypothetical protein DENSPDRAFT_844612 [Dentipellis sp. KUC8613]|nr:hypothetical protein DENSPDRAFT_844612 [Dentipellis sp. KUC8613]
MPLALDRAILAAIFTECVMYGICLTLTAVTVLVLHRTKFEGISAHKALLVTLLFMFILATVHVILSFVGVFCNFILHSNPRATNKSSAHFDEISSPVSIAKGAIYLVQTLLGNGFYIWRCYMVWGKHKKIIISPVVIMLAGIACACMIEDTSPHAVGNISGSETHDRWVKAYFFLMLVMTLYCNVAITWKVRATERAKRSPTLFLILEAGVLYTSILVILLVVLMVESNGQYIVLDSITPLMPILFCLIVLQIKYYNANGSDGYIDDLTMSHTAMHKAFHTPKKRQCQAAVAAALSNLEAQPVEVNISSSTEHYTGDNRAAELKARKEFPELHDGSDSNSDV